jgi:hypothetical protein
MKHLEEFKLNENLVGLREDNQQFQQIKDIVMSDLFQDFEFTDNILDNPNAMKLIDEYTQKILDGYLSLVKSLGEKLESEYFSTFAMDTKPSTYDSRGGEYSR